MSGLTARKPDSLVAEAVRLYVECEKSSTDIAADLGVSPAWVYSAIVKAKVARPAGLTKRLQRARSTEPFCKSLIPLKYLDGRFRERFFAKVSMLPEAPGCWIWTGSTAQLGYGHIWLVYGRRLFPAHRLSYIMTRGQIPESLELDHLCRVPCCVNPWHLEPVTHLENVHRAVGIGSGGGKASSAKTHCPQGHAYDEANTYWTRSGSRLCRICRRVGGRKYRQQRDDAFKGRVR